ncbi:glycine zipper 2TM domain-containing protein [Sphingopyxis sp. MWB1]|uniref:glycine zipper 2TM domain-containing protein n=1 Tax=Sphingopyxis sp. MWB1 TaxID=1537715 RepID=UPI00051A5461|nr:glycine zipper 2TM domain-containing protein [Sphingopyxis sp. MWB1]
MRSILLLGAATGSLLLAGQAAGTETQAPRLDYGAPATVDTRVYTGHPDRVPSEVEYRSAESYHQSYRHSGTSYAPPPPADATFHGSYDAEGRWTGTWDGTYETRDGRRYDGRYEGTVEGRPGYEHGQAYGYAPPPGGYPGGYMSAEDQDMARRCGHGSQVGGAVVGGLVGGLAGNRIAGKGNRTAGTLIGGGVGALAGAAIGNAADRKKCEQWWASRSTHYQGSGYYQGHPGGYYQGGYSSAYHGGYGYGWYSPGVVVVTTITSGAPAVTETVETTTRTYYENVPTRKRIAKKKSWKPRPKAKPKPRCVC